ncbi:late embryogenesis abundant protein At1g64065 [Musa acuminata AAA Group]|uniref:(wild Malaysian banana) hypothetical protein n=1 Tax=Musa acuminata subsp. malaccensis TaxID=214687 RepID=A0A804IQ37_MUSAM|nr:PREDICTED: late embryogenesis abundant protein At1g64065-like [Musa acuminata subsp. malaccensis]CAG1842275.1 unnamed protein product [Musa acuminata subsp. malaccensis]
MAGKREEEQVKPIMLHSPSIVPVGDDEEAASRWRSIQYLHKRRCALCCCGCCGATVVILGITILILSLTVFKVKDPTLTMNSLTLDTFRVGPGTLDNLVLFNATLVADISIKNPNVASFRFDNSTTDFYYAGETVGVAYAPQGKVSAHRTARMNVTVDVLTDRVVKQMNITTEAWTAGTELNLTSFTDIKGRVNVLGVYKRDIEVMLNCSMTLELSTTFHGFKNTDCSANVS